MGYKKETEMKITKSQLKQIIKEALNEEISPDQIGPDSRSDMEKRVAALEDAVMGLQNILNAQRNTK